MIRFLLNLFKKTPIKEVSVAEEPVVSEVAPAAPEIIIEEAVVAESTPIEDVVIEEAVIVPEPVVAKVKTADTLNEKELYKVRKNQRGHLRDLEGINSKVETSLIAANIQTYTDLITLEADDLLAMDGVGKKTCEKIMAEVEKIKQYLA